MLRIEKMALPTSAEAVGGYSDTPTVIQKLAEASYSQLKILNALRKWNKADGRWQELLGDWPWPWVVVSLEWDFS